MDKAARYLGIARKAGYLEIGAENCGAAVRSGKAKLLLLASDASDNARQRAEGFIYGRNTPLAVLPDDKETLSGLTGTPNCAMLAFTDIGLASSDFCRSGGEGEKGKSAQTRGGETREKPENGQGKEVKYEYIDEIQDPRGRKGFWHQLQGHFTDSGRLCGGA
jgi:ribosomal protein L7Ae-like RNA K-turn-binding protein